MDKKLLFSCVVLSLTACSKSLDMSYNENGGNSDQDVPNTFEVSVDPQHTWNMVQQGTLKVTALPADFETKVVMVLDANPFIDESASILAYSEDIHSAISYEAPSHLTELYAACVNGDQMKVRPFNISEGKVDFKKDQLQFSSSASAPARRAAANLEFVKTVNATLFADKGWNDEIAQVPAGQTTVHFTNFKEYASTFQAFLPENTRNNRKVAAYDNILQYYRAIVSEENGEVTVIPVHKESVNSQCIGYYYFLPGETHDIKTVKKYYFPSISKIDDSVNECTQQALRLQYFDQEGNASYQFPKGTEIFFFLHVDQTTYNTNLRNLIGSKTHIDWYAEGNYNVDISNTLYEMGYGTSNAEDGWREFSHVVMFERNGEKFVGMEDWVQDFDYNDIIFMIRGDVESFPSIDDPVPSHTHIYSYAFEDTQSGDYDLNDVVLQVKRIYGGQVRNEVKLVALGAMDRIKAYYTNEEGVIIPLFGGKELHDAVGVPQNSFVNTESQNVEDSKLPTQEIPFDYKKFLYSKADFFIVNETKNQVVHVPTALGQKGKNPNGVCIPFAWQWPKERVRIFTAYPLFKGFAENMEVNTDWYTQPAEGQVFK